MYILTQIGIGDGFFGLRISFFLSQLSVVEEPKLRVVHSQNLRIDRVLTEIRQIPVDPEGAPVFITELRTYW